MQETVLLAGSKKGAINTFVVDITNRVSVEDIAGNVIAKCAYVDGIINNAGIIQPFVRANDLSYEAIERVININF